MFDELASGRPYLQQFLIEKDFLTPDPDSPSPAGNSKKRKDSIEDPATSLNSQLVSGSADWPEHESDDTEEGSILKDHKTEDKGKGRVSNAPTARDWLTEGRAAALKGFVSHVLTSSLNLINFNWDKSFWAKNKDKAGSAGLAIKSQDGATGWANRNTSRTTS